MQAANLHSSKPINRKGWPSLIGAQIYQFVLDNQPVRWQSALICQC